MTWPGLDLELIQVVGGGELRGGVSEAPPAMSRDLPGRTLQRVTLLLPDEARLTPPARVIVRGMEMRILGTQMPPEPGAGSLVTCELVNPDLPDLIAIGSLERGEYDSETGTYPDIFTKAWEGPANIEGGTPAVIDSGGERAPLDRVEISLPLAAPVTVGCIVKVLYARHPSVAGGVYTTAGEVDSSTSSLRTVIAYRAEVS